MFGEAMRTRSAVAATLVTAGLALAPAASAADEGRTGPAEPASTSQTHVLNLATSGGGVVVFGGTNVYTRSDPGRPITDAENCMQWQDIYTATVAANEGRLRNAETDHEYDVAEINISSVRGAAAGDGCVVV